MAFFNKMKDFRSQRILENVGISEEKSLIEWLNDPRNAKDFAAFYQHNQNNDSLAWYFLNINPKMDFFEKQYGYEGNDRRDIGVYKNVTSRLSGIVTQDIPFQLIGRHDWKTKIENVEANARRGLQPALDRLHALQHSENEWARRYKLTALCLIGLCYLTDQRDQPYTWAYQEISKLFRQPLHELSLDSLKSTYEAIGGFPGPDSNASTNDICVILDHLMAIHAVRMTYQGVHLLEQEASISELFNGFQRSFQNQRDSDIELKTQTIFDKYLCVNEKLLDQPLTNANALYGYSGDVQRDSMIRNWQRGFLPAAGDTEYIDKVFETNAFDSENLYLPGIKADYVLRYAYRTRPVHWERAAEKMLVSNAKDDLLRITYLLNENEAPEHSALVCKRMLTETAFGTSKEAWPLLTRCVRNVDGLIDQLYLAVNMSSRKGNRVFQTLSSLGTPSMAIYDELDPSLRRLKLSTELGL